MSHTEGETRTYEALFREYDRLSGTYWRQDDSYGQLHAQAKAVANAAIAFADEIHRAHFRQAEQGNPDAEIERLRNRHADGWPVLLDERVRVLEHDVKRLLQQDGR